jgi:hypothetical protein
MSRDRGPIKRQNRERHARGMPAVPIRDIPKKEIHEWHPAGPACHELNVTTAISSRQRIVEHEMYFMSRTKYILCTSFSNFGRFKRHEVQNMYPIFPFSLH